MTSLDNHFTLFCRSNGFLLLRDYQGTNPESALTKLFMTYLEKEHGLLGFKIDDSLQKKINVVSKFCKLSSAKMVGILSDEEIDLLLNTNTDSTEVGPLSGPLIQRLSDTISYPTDNDKNQQRRYLELMYQFTQTKEIPLKFVLLVAEYQSLSHLFK